MEVNLIVKLEMMPCWCLFYNYADIRLLSVLAPVLSTGYIQGWLLLISSSLKT
jgi:hypothetical protein